MEIDDTFYDLPGGRYFKSLVQDDVTLYININETSCLIMSGPNATIESVAHVAQIAQWGGFAFIPSEEGDIITSDAEYSFTIHYEVKTKEKK